MTDASFSRTIFPPGGWQYYQSQTGWTNPTPKSSTFGQVVQQIIDMRRKNPAILIQHKLSLDHEQVGNELETYTRARLGMAVAAPPAPMFTSPQPLALVIKDAGDVKKLATGAALLFAWNESGEPAVDQETATKRAAMCETCPCNSMAKLADWQTIPVAGAIRDRMKRLNEMNLSTPSDGKLGLCLGFFCPLSVLVHAPMAVIAPRLPKITGLDERCWATK